MAKRTDRPPPQEPRRPPRREDRGARGPSGTLIVVLAAFWLLLSGRIGLQYLVFMAVSVAIVAALNPDRPLGQADPSRGRGASGRLQAAVHLVRYLVWLVWNVVRANVDVAYRILHPKMPIDPRLMTFRTDLRHGAARVLVANSITLTPGTVTIDLVDDTYLVHALHPETAGAVVSASLQNAVGPVFGDTPDPPPDVRWTSSYEATGWGTRLPRDDDR